MFLGVLPALPVLSLLLRDVEISEVRDVFVFGGSQVEGWA